MTWLFVYASFLILGVLLVGVAGLVRDVPLRSANRRLVVPTADHRAGPLGRQRVTRCVGVALIAAGLIGIVLSAWMRAPSAVVAAAAAAAAALAAACVALSLRTGQRRRAPSGRAVVVREMQPGAYGQIRIEGGGRSVLMAAQNVGDETLGEGCEVEVVAGERSVVAVRRAEIRR